MQLNRLTLDEDGLEGLYTKTMKRRSAVEQHRVLSNDFFEDVPYFGHFLLNQLFSSLDRRGQTEQLKLVEDKWLKQFERHLFGQAALMQLKLRTDHDDRTAGVIHALA